MPMNAKFNEKTGKFNLIYFDAVKEFNGDKYPYSRKQVAWKGKKKPTQREIKIEIAKLLQEGEQLEECARLEVEKMKHDFKVIDNGEVKLEEETNGVVNALKYFLQIDPASISKAKTKNFATLSRQRNFLKAFTEFLKKDFPLLPLHEIKKPVIEKYFKAIESYSYDMQSHHFFYLSKIWKKVIDDFEESPVKYVNHFEKYGIEEFVQEKKPFEKMPFTVEQLLSITTAFVFPEFVLKYKHKSKGMKEQLFFILYFLTVTGWRIGDILKLTWEQVNLRERTITLTFGKTADSTGQECVIFITPLMKEILLRQQENAKDYPFNAGFVFNIRGKAGDTVDITHYANKISEMLQKALVKRGILKTKKSDFGMNYSNYTTHCIRKSVITELNLAKQYTSERIHYLVGHADNSIEAKHYLKFKLYPERSTRDMLEYMEELTNMRFFFNIVVHGITKANEILNKQKFISETEIAILKTKFWTDEAIHALRFGLDKGYTLSNLDGFAQHLNEVRLEAGEKFVTPDMVILEFKKIFDLWRQDELHKGEAYIPEAYIDERKNEF